MKRLTALFSLAAVMVCFLCPVCGEEADYKALYEPILVSIAQQLSCENPDDHIPGPGEAGIRENRIGIPPQQALRNVGYSLRDLSGDGIPELLIAQVDSREGELCFGTQILAIFNFIQGKPSLTLEGWARNRYYLLPDNSLLNQGSSGAAYSCLGLYRLTPEGNELNCLDFFFTWEEDGQVAVYHNTDGVWEVPHEGNELLDLDLWRMSEILEADIQPMELVDFASYQSEEHPSLLVPQWYQDGFLENCPEITLSTEEYSTQIALCAYHGAVTDVQLLQLELEDMGEDGAVRFAQTVLQTIPAVEPETPVILRLCFSCNIPNFGIRYTDSTGTTKTFSLAQSGMDGSLLMNEIP